MTPEEQYEVQLFGFCVKDVCDEVAELLLHHVDSIISDIQNAICKDSDDKYDSQFVALKALYKKAIPTLVLNLQMKLKRHIGIAFHELLEEDKIQQRQYTSQEIADLLVSTQHLEKKLLKVKYMKEVLLAELKFKKHLLIMIKKSSHNLEILEKINDEKRQLREKIRHVVQVFLETRQVMCPSENMEEMVFKQIFINSFHL